MNTSKQDSHRMTKAVVTGGVIAAAATAAAVLLRDKKNREKVVKTTKDAVKTLRENPALAGTVGAVIGKVTQLTGEKIEKEVADQDAETAVEKTVTRRRTAAAI